MKNKGFDPIEIEKIQMQISRFGRNFIPVESDDNSDEYFHFQFIGTYEGRPVIYDAAMYTLRLHHSSEVYEIAEHKAAQHFPDFKSISYDEDENGNLSALNSREEEIGLFMAEIIMELEEEGQVKVKEHVEFDPHIDFGVGIDIGLNVEKITPRIIERFIFDFNNNSLQLDPTLYAFQTQGEED